MKMILGCLLVLTGTALAVGQTLPPGQTALDPIPPPAPESRQNTEQTPPDVAAAVERPGASQTTQDLPQPPAVTITGLDSSPENSQPNAAGSDLAQSPVAEFAAASDAHQVGTKVRAHVESPALRSCTYLGCRGHTLLGIGF